MAVQVGRPISQVCPFEDLSLVIIFSMNGTISRQLYETLLWPTFVATNGLATYAPPLILVFRSRRARALLFGGLRGQFYARAESTVHTVTNRTR